MAKRAFQNPEISLTAEIAAQDVAEAQSATARAFAHARERGADSASFSRAALLRQQGDLLAVSDARAFAVELYQRAADDIFAVAQMILPKAPTPAMVPCPVQGRMPRPVPRPTLERQH